MDITKNSNCRNMPCEGGIAPLNKAEIEKYKLNYGHLP
jgi:hypothetical protein